jgi:hypothetical protein
MKANQRRAMFARMSAKNPQFLSSRNIDKCGLSESEKKEMIKHFKEDIREQKTGISRDKKAIKELENPPRPPYRELLTREQQLGKESLMRKEIKKKYPNMSDYAVNRLVEGKDVYRE